MEVHIKNMVCHRCVMVVTDIFEKAGIHPDWVELGKVLVNTELTNDQMQVIEKELNSVGFEIIDDAKGRLIAGIKSAVVDLVHHQKDDLKVNHSVYLEEKLKRDYNYLSNLFSSVEGQTIEKYIINQEIEKVKELLIYGDQTLSEIAYAMGYSSVSHLSGQFKKVTGFNPSQFKSVGGPRRRPIDEV